jgi:hypothetical protein
MDALSVHSCTDSGAACAQVVIQTDVLSVPELVDEGLDDILQVGAHRLKLSQVTKLVLQKGIPSSLVSRNRSHHVTNYLKVE